MRFLIAIPLIIIGALLLGLTNDDIDYKGKVIIYLMGWAFFLGGILIGRRKRGRNQSP
ncbi:hypothetical protein [Ferdinandcohnia sp. SAFN-114]|uniref:hypothetical protein n=1 Tax=Ferdinandcohnia sp. SAFN-114 TaxID=3387275 RepID=UPI003F805DB7